MKRIDTPGSVANRFDDGQPFASGGPIAGSVVSSDFMNVLTDEIVFLVETEGLTLDQTSQDTTQVHQAIEALVDRIAGRVFTFTATEDMTAGDGFQHRDVFVVIAADVLNGNPATGYTRGRFSLDKIAAENHTKGDALYWDQTLRQVSTNSNGGARPNVGYADESAGAATTSIFVRVGGPVAL